MQHQPCYGTMRQSSNYIRPASCRTSSEVCTCYMHSCLQMYATRMKNTDTIFFQDWESQRLCSNDLSQQYTTTAVIAAVDTTYSTSELLTSHLVPTSDNHDHYVFTTLLAMCSRHYSCLMVVLHKIAAFYTEQCTTTTLKSHKVLVSQ